MKRNYKMIIAALSVAAILAAAGTTAALAASQASPAAVSAPAEADYEAWGCPVANGNYTAVADLLGMTPEELSAQLQQGKSLVEIASGKGVTEDKLVAAIMAPMQQFMQERVTAGVWTQAQTDARLKLAEEHVRELVNAKGGTGSFGYGAYGCGGFGANGGPALGRGGMMGGFGGGYGGMMGGWRR